MPGRRLVYVIVSCACVIGAHAGKLRLTAVDFDTARPVPCRIHLKDTLGKPVRPKVLPFWHDHFVCPGEVQLDLAPGAYPYEIERGPEYFPATGTLSVTESGPQTVTNRLRRLAHRARENWWSGELHVHRPPADIELLAQAEDLHVASVVTWWNDNNAWKS